MRGGYLPPPPRPVLFPLEFAAPAVSSHHQHLRLPRSPPRRRLPLLQSHGHIMHVHTQVFVAHAHTHTGYLWLRLILRKCILQVLNLAGPVNNFFSIP